MALWHSIEALSILELDELRCAAVRHATPRDHTSAAVYNSASIYNYMFILRGKQRTKIFISLILETLRAGPNARHNKWRPMIKIEKVLVDKTCKNKSFCQIFLVRWIFSFVLCSFFVYRRDFVHWLSEGLLSFHMLSIWIIQIWKFIQVYIAKFIYSRVQQSIWRRHAPSWTSRINLINGFRKVFAS